LKIFSNNKIIVRTEFQTSERDEYFERNNASADVKRIAQILFEFPLYHPQRDKFTLLDQNLQF